MFKIIFLLILILFLILTPIINAQIITFESQFLGQQFGAVVGYSPGDVIFSEYDIPIRVQKFEGGESAFNLAQIDVAFSGFGTGKHLQPNQRGHSSLI